MTFKTVREFESRIADFFGSPYAVAVDSCTHGVELSLRYTNAKRISVPRRTYPSIPFLARKLNISLVWNDEEWKDYYYLTKNVIDAAVLWEMNSYISDTFMSVSFQFKKHLNLIRGGVILTDNREAAIQLKKMSHDGRSFEKPWREQNLDTVGYAYYMTPETAAMGLDKLDAAIITTSRKWSANDYPDLTKMDIFKK